MMHGQKNINTVMFTSCTRARAHTHTYTHSPVITEEFSDHKSDFSVSKTAIYDKVKLQYFDTISEHGDVGFWICQTIRLPLILFIMSVFVLYNFTTTSTSIHLQCHSYSQTVPLRLGYVSPDGTMPCFFARAHLPVFKLDCGEHQDHWIPGY